MAKEKTGINKEHEFSDDFENIFGLGLGTRGEAVKAVWAYAKANDLSKSREKNGRNQACITTNSAMKSLFVNSKYLFMGDIAKGISSHIVE